MGTKPAMRVRSRVARGKDALTSDRLRQSGESYGTKLESGTSVLRQNIRARVDRYEELLEIFDQHSRQMRIVFLRLMDCVEESKSIVRAEREEAMKLIQLIDSCSFGKRNTSLRTHTVRPMIFGIPLKKPSILLRRLDPLREQLNQSISTVTADSSPASDVGFPQPIGCTTLPGNVESLQIVLPESSPIPLLSQSPSSSGSEQSSEYLSRYQERHKRWKVSSTPEKGYHLKRATIPLKRLNLQQRGLETGIKEPLNSRKMPFPSNDAGRSDVDSVCANDTDRETSRTDPECIMQDCASCPSHQEPLVVLKKLQMFSNSFEKKQDNDTTSSFTDSNTYSIQGTSQMNLRNTCKTHDKHKDLQGLMKKSPKLSVASTCCVKKRKIDASEKHELNRSNNTGEKTTKRNKTQKKWETSNLKKEKYLQLSPSSAEKIDEDPLEGPSWLYKDGVKKEKLRKMEKIRQEYLTPIYYLTPTIYPSTDESCNEVTEMERKGTKLRKKKTKKGSRNAY